MKLCSVCELFKPWPKGSRMSRHLSFARGCRSFAGPSFLCFGTILLWSLMAAGFAGCGRSDRRAEDWPAAQRLKPEVAELLQAAAGGDINAVRLKIQSYPELVNASNDMGETPLSRAVGALRPKPELVRFLLDAGANVEGAEADRFVPLHIAAGKGEIGIIELLLARGAQINRRDALGHTALWYAVAANQRRAAQFLIQRGAEISIFEAAALGNTRKLFELLARDPALLNARDEAGMTALHWAVLRNQEGAVKFLVKRGANVTLADRSGATPVELAIREGHRQLIPLLQR